MSEMQEPNRRDKLYASDDHEVEYFRGMLEKHLRRMREAMFSDDLSALAPALASAQAEFQTPKRTKHAMVTQTRGYNYADLQDVLTSVRDPLAKHGLSITQMTQEFAGQVELVTLLLHSSGQWLRSVYPVKAKTERPQEFGSALTYARRYTLSALLGIASEEDDDAQGAQEAAKTAGRDPELSAAQKQQTAKRTQRASEPDLAIMSPETGEFEETFKRTVAGAKGFMMGLEQRCRADTRYWRLHHQTASDISVKLPQLCVDEEPIGKMVERLSVEYGGVEDVDDGGASPLI